MALWGRYIHVKLVDKHEAELYTGKEANNNR